MEKILQNAERKIFREPTSGQPARPVPTLVSQGGAVDYTETEAVSFLNSLNCSKAKQKKIDPNGSSVKMLEDCFRLIRDGIFSNIYLFSTFDYVKRRLSLRFRRSDFFPMPNG